VLSPLTSSSASNPAWIVAVSNIVAADFGRGDALYPGKSAGPTDRIKSGVAFFLPAGTTTAFAA
jgi:hypothetical protein